MLFGMFVWYFAFQVLFGINPDLNKFRHWIELNIFFNLSAFCFFVCWTPKIGSVSTVSLQYSTVQHSRVSKMQYCQYSTVQYSIVLTVQYSVQKVILSDSSTYIYLNFVLTIAFTLRAQLRVTFVACESRFRAQQNTQKVQNNWKTKQPVF